MAFRDFIESKKYLKIRKKYLEMSATLPNKKLDARVNSLLQVQQELKEYPTPISICDIQFNALLEERNKLIMEAKEKSPRREKKKPKKDKKKLLTSSEHLIPCSVKETWILMLERFSGPYRM